MLDATTTQLQRAQIRQGAGFIAALDQSGGSTPKALAAYGVPESQWTGDAEMFAAVHAMRCRIMQSPSFSGGRVLGAILFERTLRDKVGGLPTARYLWERAGVVPFLKVDAGLAALENGVQLMKPIDRLAELLALSTAQSVYGTKMRSVIAALSPTGIDAVVAQQFAIGRQILAQGLVPMIEPEVDIHADQRATIEAHLADSLLAALDTLDAGDEVILKLSLPEVAGQYAPLCAHPRVQRVVALSGGFARDAACARLAQNPGMIASFSRALVEGLSVTQSDDAFDATLAATIDQIATASC